MSHVNICQNLKYFFFRENFERILRISRKNFNEHFRENERKLSVSFSFSLKYLRKKLNQNLETLFSNEQALKPIIHKYSFDYFSSQVFSFFNRNNNIYFLFVNVE